METEIKQYFILVDSKLDPLVQILRNINTFLAQNLDLSDRQEMILSTKLIQKKIKRVLDLSKVLDDHQLKLQGQAIITDALHGLTTGLQFEISEQFKNEIKICSNEEMLRKQIEMLGSENKQLRNEVHIRQETTQEGLCITFISLEAQNDKIIEMFRSDNSNLMNKLILSTQIISQLHHNFEQFDGIVNEIKANMEQSEIKFHQSMMYKELSIEALQDQITLYEKRVKQFKKKVPIYNDTPQSMQIINLYKVLVQLEEETFKIHQNYQSRIATYTQDNLSLRQKVNGLEKIVNALSQSQSDNQHIMIKMKTQGDKIAELSYQNDQMREVLKSRSLLEKRIKELEKLEQKQKDQKQKDEKEAKRLQEVRLKEEKDLKAKESKK